MTSALGAVPALIALTVLILLPPVLCVALATKRALRAHSRGRTIGSYLGVGAFGIVALCYNTAVMLPTAVILLDRGITLNALHWVALALSWLCLWATFLLMILRRTRRRMAYQRHNA
jgi:hypothetical protein